MISLKYVEIVEIIATFFLGTTQLTLISGQLHSISKQLYKQELKIVNKTDSPFNVKPKKFSIYSKTLALGFRSRLKLLIILLHLSVL